MTDFLLAGAVRLRLLGEGPAERASVTADTGLTATTAHGDADIVIRYEDPLPLTETPVFVGPRAAYAGDAFLLLPTRHARTGRSVVPMDTLGGRIEMVCEPGASGVPFLRDLLNLTALSKGLLPMHAAAVTLDGHGLLITGWSKGGKTECVLALLRRGATVVGDEWVYVCADGSRVMGMPHPVRLWGWHLAQMPELWRRLERRDRRRLRATALALPAAGRLPLTRPLVPALDRRDGVFVPLALVADGRHAESARLDEIVLVESRQLPDVVREPIPATEVVERMRHSLRYERRQLLEAYDAFRFAFPSRQNPFLDGLDALEHELLRSRLGSMPATRLLHPYEVDFDELSMPLGRAPAPTA